MRLGNLLGTSRKTDKFSDTSQHTLIGPISVRSGKNGDITCYPLCNTYTLGYFAFNSVPPSQLICATKEDTLFKQIWNVGASFFPPATMCRMHSWMDRTIGGASPHMLRTFISGIWVLWRHHQAKSNSKSVTYFHQIMSCSWDLIEVTWFSSSMAAWSRYWVDTIFWWQCWTV